MKYTHKWADAQSSSEDTLLSDSKGAPAYTQAACD